MESIISYFQGFGLDLPNLLKAALMLLVGSLLISCIFRFIFRKQTMISSAVSSSIAIIFIHVVMVLIVTVFTDLGFLVTPLPFASISTESIRFFSFSSSGYTAIAAELLSMIILAFLVNLVDGWMPKTKNLLKWVFWKVLTVALGFALHYLVTLLFNRYLPQGIVMYAPVILLAILMIMLLTGALKLVLGLVLATVNPLIGALYTFFFANIVGKQITKAVLTTGVLSGVLVLLQKLQIVGLSLASGALVAYIPFLLILTLVWYAISWL